MTSETFLRCVWYMGFISFIEFFFIVFRLCEICKELRWLQSSNSLARSYVFIYFTSYYTTFYTM